MALFTGALIDALQSVPILQRLEIDMPWTDEELAKHLSASAASNEADFVMDALKKIAIEYRWSAEEFEAVLDVITKFRVMALKNFAEFHEAMDK